MKIIYRPRQSGKTTEAIKESAKTGCYIVCHSWDQCTHIVKLADKMGLKIPYPLTFREFEGGHYYSKGIRGFIIDNAELLLQSMTDVPIKTITLSQEEFVEEEKNE